MPGYNHYSWCMCGWCYKTGSNGYSGRKIVEIDHPTAERIISRSGANRSYSARFVVPNASCPVCGASVFYYQNEHGSRVFFDELGWPWPKHPCTDTFAREQSSRSRATPIARSVDSILEIAKAAQQIDFDPALKFRFTFGHSPWDLMCVIELCRCRFENFVKAKSISPFLDEQVFVTFVSTKIIPVVGEFFGFSEEEVSFLDIEALRPKRFKARRIPEAEYLLSQKTAS